MEILKGLGGFWGVVGSLRGFNGAGGSLGGPWGDFGGSGRGPLVMPPTSLCPPKVSPQTSTGMLKSPWDPQIPPHPLLIAPIPPCPAAALARKMPAKPKHPRRRRKAQKVGLGRRLGPRSWFLREDWGDFWGPRSSGPSPNKGIDEASESSEESEEEKPEEKEWAAILS